jgi:hypothetical protein
MVSPTGIGANHCIECAKHGAHKQVPLLNRNRGRGRLVDGVPGQRQRALNGTLGTLAKVGHGREIVSALGWTASNALVRANISTQLECILAPIGERTEERGAALRGSNLCPLCGRHSAPLFSPRSRPMNGTVSRTRPGSSDLANATVTARDPTATEKPSTFLRSSKTGPATGRRGPAISGRRKKPKLRFNRWMGRMGTAPLLVDERRLFAGSPHLGEQVAS